jgi:hypothetical protein
VVGYLRTTQVASWSIGKHRDARRASIIRSAFHGGDAQPRSRGRIGIEFTYLNFSIDARSTLTRLARGGDETEEDFYHQSMPLPTIGLKAYRRLNKNLLFQAEVERKLDQPLELAAQRRRPGVGVAKRYRGSCEIVLFQPFVVRSGSADDRILR